MDEKKRFLKPYEGRGRWVQRCLGEVYLEEGRFLLATTAFQRALKHESEDPTLWERLGTVHFRMQRMTSALKVKQMIFLRSGKV